MATQLAYKTHSYIHPLHDSYTDTLPYFTYQVYKDGVLFETVTERFLSKAHLLECVAVWNYCASLMGEVETPHGIMPCYYYKASV